MIFETLGHECALCGATEDLTLDCIEPRGSVHHDLGYAWRQSFYLEQFRQGNVWVLCRSCNASKGARPYAHIRHGLAWRRNLAAEAAVNDRIRRELRGGVTHALLPSRQHHHLRAGTSAEPAALPYLRPAGAAPV